MLKHTLLALAGLAVVVPTASADTSLPLLPRPDLSDVLTPFESPAFDRMVDLCDRFGVACSIHGTRPLADADDFLDLIPRAQADAAKQWELYADEWAEIAELYDHYEPVPGPAPRLYGWGAGPDRLTEIDELLESVQERLDHRPGIAHVLPRPRFSWQHGLGGLPRAYSFGHGGPAIINHYGAPNRPGNSIIILPSR